MWAGMFGKREKGVGVGGGWLEGKGERRVSRVTHTFGIY